LISGFQVAVIPPAWARWHCWSSQSSPPPRPTRRRHWGRVRPAD